MVDIEYNPRFTTSLQDGIVKCLKVQLPKITKAKFETTNSDDLTVIVEFDYKGFYITYNLFNSIKIDIDIKHGWIMDMWDHYPKEYLKSEQDSMWFHFRAISHREKVYKSLMTQKDRAIVRSFFNILKKCTPEQDMGYFLELCERYYKYGWDTALWDGNAQRVLRVLETQYDNTRDHLKGNIMYKEVT